MGKQTGGKKRGKIIFRGSIIGDIEMTWDNFLDNLPNQKDIDFVEKGGTIIFDNTSVAPPSRVIINNTPSK